ncbi:endonuclease domain-containing protein [Microbacterium sp. No. 7]|uniref:endonuclease domain-containing protein n=1 Tax=Microbacterium sp. No. 7 TaxID=1714373 RepID=UPI00300A26D8
MSDRDGMRARSLPDGLGEPFSVAQARAAGVNRSRLRAADLTRPFHGVRSTAVPDGDLAQMVAAYACAMSPHVFFSHVTAAELWGMPLPSSAGGPLHVSVRAPHRAPAGAGVVGHAVHPSMVGVVRHPLFGVPVTSPATTWAMLGGALGNVRDLVATADAAVREPMHPADPPPLTTRTQLERAVAAGRRVGAARLREALPRVSVRSRSRPETWVRLIVVDAGFPPPAVNHDVVARGMWLAQVDLAYPARRVALEYEGEHHLTDPAQWAADLARYDRLVEAGWRVLRVTKGDVFGDPRDLLARLGRALA